jgi:hypothetical protein
MLPQSLSRQRKEVSLSPYKSNLYQLYSWSFTSLVLTWKGNIYHEERKFYAGILWKRTGRTGEFWNFLHIWIFRLFLQLGNGWFDKSQRTTCWMLGAMDNSHVLVSSSSLWKTTWVKQTEGGKVCFDSWFQMLQSVESWLCCFWAHGETEHGRWKHA